MTAHHLGPRLEDRWYRGRWPWSHWRRDVRWVVRCSCGARFDDYDHGMNAVGAASDHQFAEWEKEPREPRPGRATRAPVRAHRGVPMKVGTVPCPFCDVECDITASMRGLNPVGGPTVAMVSATALVQHVLNDCPNAPTPPRPGAPIPMEDVA